MLNYKNTFIGIPLPEKFRFAFESLLINVDSLDAGLKVVSSKNPHITLYYLHTQSLSTLNKISKSIKSDVFSVKDISLNIGTYTIFESNSVLCLKVDPELKLNNLYIELKSKLSRYHSSDYSVFQPHLTIGYIVNNDKFLIKQSQIKDLLNTFKANFLIEEVFVYGKKEAQEKLIRIL